MQLAPTILTLSAQHALALDDSTRAALTIQHRPLSTSARIDAMGVYLTRTNAFVLAACRNSS